MKTKIAPVQPGHDPELEICCQTIKPGTAPSGLIRYGTCPTPFGKALVALSQNGVCALRFGGKIGELALEWPGAEFKEEKKAVKAIGEQIFGGGPEPIPVHLMGSSFQIEVWLGLLSIPMGSLVSYHELARELGKPLATRSVASAIAKNGIGYLVPCHRVIPADGGGCGKYRWGSDLKREIIEWETALVAK